MRLPLVHCEIARRENRVVDRANASSAAGIVAGAEAGAARSSDVNVTDSSTVKAVTDSSTVGRIPTPRPLKRSPISRLSERSPTPRLSERSPTPRPSKRSDSSTVRASHRLLDCRAVTDSSTVEAVTDSLDRRSGHRLLDCRSPPTPRPLKRSPLPRVDSLECPSPAVVTVLFKSSRESFVGALSFGGADFCVPRDE